MRFSINIGNFTSPGGPESIGRSLLHVALAADECGIGAWSVEVVERLATAADLIAAARSVPERARAMSGGVAVRR
jgi:hypothetical protein